MVFDLKNYGVNAIIRDSKKVNNNQLYLRDKYISEMVYSSDRNSLISAKIYYFSKLFKINFLLFTALVKPKLKNNFFNIRYKNTDYTLDI